MNIVFVASAFAQQQAFDVVNYTMPKGWDKTEMPNGIQLSTKNDGKENYAAVVILRSVETKATANENFNASWEKLVKGTVSVSGEPTMQAPATEKGWSIISGQASYTNGANKGMATLITATGNGKMANVVILTNTEKYQSQILDFIKSLDLNETGPAVNNNTRPDPKSANENPVSPTNYTTGSGSKNIYSITVPPTWSLNAGENSLMLEKNTTTGKRIIEFMSMIKSSGSLENDMSHIFFEVFDGWETRIPGITVFTEAECEKGMTCQGLNYYMMSNSIKKRGGYDVIKATVLLVQAGDKVAIINSMDNILGSEVEMALHFLLFNLRIKGVGEKGINYKQQLIGTWASGSGTYGNSLNSATIYTADGKSYVTIQSSTTSGYDYYNNLIKTKQFKSQSVYSFTGNVLVRKSSSGSESKYFIRFYSRRYGDRPWESYMSLYDCNYDKNKIEAALHFHKI